MISTSFGNVIGSFIFVASGLPAVALYQPERLPRWRSCLLGRCGRRSAALTHKALAKLAADLTADA